MLTPRKLPGLDSPPIAANGLPCGDAGVEGMVDSPGRVRAGDGAAAGAAAAAGEVDGAGGRAGAGGGTGVCTGTGKGKGVTGGTGAGADSGGRAGSLGSGATFGATFGMAAVANSGIFSGTRPGTGATGAGGTIGGGGGGGGSNMRTRRGARSIGFSCASKLTRLRISEPETTMSNAPRTATHIGTVAISDGAVAHNAPARLARRLFIMLKRVVEPARSSRCTHHNALVVRATASIPAARMTSITLMIA